MAIAEILPPRQDALIQDNWARVLQSLPDLSEEDQKQAHSIISTQPYWEREPYVACGADVAAKLVKRCLDAASRSFMPILTTCVYSTLTNSCMSPCMIT